MKRVYFIKPIGMLGPVKIGCSCSPDNRRESLEAWAPFPLEIIAEVEGGFDLESRFHALFIETHQRREWFGWSNRIATVVAAINDGTFDLTALPRPIKVAHLVAGRKAPNRLRPYSAAHHFTSAYNARIYALWPRGLHRTDDSARAPNYSVTDRLALDGDHIRACEAYCDEMTAKYGHSGLKPVRWRGAYPDAQAPRSASL